MNARRLSLVCLLALVASPTVGQPRPDPATEAERLVKQLGSPRFADREAAYRALEALGPAAVPSLRRIIPGTDAETRRRVGELIARYERQADSVVAFAPTKVRVKVAGDPLAAVVQDLSRQARIQVGLAREPLDLAERPVTLDTGETSYFEALDALCRQAQVSLRAGAFDPSGPASLRGRVPALQLAEGGISGHLLVLQDGVLPPCPTAHLGAVRVRLVPDRWANRGRGPADEHRWTLEVLCEPRVLWHGPPAFRFEPTAGVAASPYSQAADNVTPYFGRVDPYGLSALKPVTRYEAPVYLRGEPATGRPVPELKGVLAGTVQLPAELALIVADVRQAGAAGTAAADGTKVVLRDRQVNDKGEVKLRMEVVRPTPPDLRAALRGERGMGFGEPTTAADAQGMLVRYGRDGEAMRLFDEQDRPYKTRLLVSELISADGVTTAKYVLEAVPAGPGAQPRKLELHAPRRAAVEATFTLRGLPRPTNGLSR